jgi:hypothetical protein
MKTRTLNLEHDSDPQRSEPTSYLTSENNYKELFLSKFKLLIKR